MPEHPPQHPPEPSPDLGPLPDAVALAVEGLVLGGSPTLTRIEVAERAGVPVAMAKELWRWLGFAHADDDAVAFTEADVEALRLSHELMQLGILSADTQAALVRTWGNSFARLAEWQASLLGSLATEENGADLVTLTSEVLPRVETLQGYVWRRHLAAASNRLIVTEQSDAAGVTLAVCFVDIVDYTSQSKHLDDTELVRWVEHFENEVTGTVIDHGGYVIKNIGDEILFVAPGAARAAEVALQLTARGADEADLFPAVRAGIAHGPVVRRLGDVFGPTVNVAARLTSVARPGTVVVDKGVHDELCQDHAPAGAAGGFRLRRLHGISVKGYARLECWVLRKSVSAASRSGTAGTRH